MTEIQKAYDFAEKEIKKEKEEVIKQQVKSIVKKTLEEIELIERRQEDLAERKKILKQDIDNLKSGRLDLIEERQEKNPKAKEVSVFRVITKKIVYPPINSLYDMYMWPISVGGRIILNGSSTATYTSGTYDLFDGVIKYL